MYYLYFKDILLGVIFQLFNLAKDKPYPVTGLQCEKMPSTSLTEYRYFVIATLPGFVEIFQALLFCAAADVGS